MGKHNGSSGYYDQTILDDIADSLEKYIELFDTFVIKEGMSEKKYKKAVKRIKKAIKSLREGDGDSVFAEGMYDELIHHQNEYSSY